MSLKKQLDLFSLYLDGLNSESESKGDCFIDKT